MEIRKNIIIIIRSTITRSTTIITINLKIPLKLRSKRKKLKSDEI